MALYLPNELPAISSLTNEGFAYAYSIDDLPYDRKVYRIGLLNLMPKKEQTEEDFARLFAAMPYDVELVLLRMESHVSKNTSADHLNRFYRTHREVAEDVMDGLIVTGAPVELMDFEQVGYWAELTDILQWSRRSVRSALYICWGAQAALYHYFKIPKHVLPAKQFGVFEHAVHYPEVPLFQGFDDLFFVPHSRHTATLTSDIEQHAELTILSSSPESGVYIVGEQNRPFFYITGHSEYAPNTLGGEYQRDLAKGLSIDIPANYYWNDDANDRPIVRWRAHANLLFSNWIKHYIR